MQEKKEIIAEIQGIFADAVEGRDLENIESRFSIAATKLDSLNDPDCKGLVEAIDAIRKSIGSDHDKAHYIVKAIMALVKGDTSVAEETLDELKVKSFISSLS